MDRAIACDSKQDQIRRTRMAAEREKMLDRQRQNSHLASQAMMVPVLALLKRNQAKADIFDSATALELVKAASFATRELPRVQAEERALVAAPEEISQPTTPIVITGAEFTWVQGRCTCGHAWNSHEQSALELGSAVQTICTAKGCRCTRFIDEDESSGS